MYVNLMGLLYECRYDRSNKKGILNGYFLWSVVGYGVGGSSGVLSFIFM